MPRTTLSQGIYPIDVPAGPCPCRPTAPLRAGDGDGDGDPQGAGLSSQAFSKWRAQGLDHSPVVEGLQTLGRFSCSQVEN